MGESVGLQLEDDGAQVAAAPLRRRRGNKGSTSSSTPTESDEDDDDEPQAKLSANNFCNLSMAEKSTLNCATLTSWFECEATWNEICYKQKLETGGDIPLSQRCWKECSSSGPEPTPALVTIEKGESSTSANGNNRGGHRGRRDSICKAYRDVLTVVNAAILLRKRGRDATFLFNVDYHDDCTILRRSHPCNAMYYDICPSQFPGRVRIPPLNWLCPQQCSK